MFTHISLKLRTEQFIFKHFPEKALVFFVSFYNIIALILPYKNNCKGLLAMNTEKLQDSIQDMFSLNIPANSSLYHLLYCEAKDTSLEFQILASYL